MTGRYKLDLREGIDFRVKRGHWLPRKFGVDFIAFGKTLYCRAPDAEVPKHEFLHIAQFAKYGIARVLMHYVFHVAGNLCQSRNLGAAFREVPFEVEAREFEADRSTGE